MATEQQVETVAAAIREAFERHVKRPKLRPWKLLPEDVRETCRAEARAAIQAYESTLK